MSAPRYVRNLVLATTLSMLGCGSEDDPQPTPEKDAGKDASPPGEDAGRDASAPDAARDASADARVSEDARVQDADLADAAIADANVADASDAKVPDANAADAGDANVPDASAPDAAIDCSPPADGVLPRDLRCTGLYKDAANKTIADGVLEYAPAYVLWSDGAEKRRFASIPAGKKIDVSKPDAFLFPDGTKFWKEFSVEGTDGVKRLAETRLVEKTPDGWLYTSYVWNAAQTQAIQMDNTLGVPNQVVGGVSHVVPTRDQCNECHGGRDDGSLQYFVLGWDALLLGPGATGVTRASLASMDLLTGGTLTGSAPGTNVEKDALGYLHANCGISCHNANQGAKARDSGLFLRLEAGELASVQATDAFRTAINKMPSANANLSGVPPLQGGWLGIRPGQPTRSLVVARQRLRGVESQMPRIGTNVVDEQGLQKVVDWIAAMPELGGYPAANP